MPTLSAPRRRFAPASIRAPALLAATSVAAISLVFAFGSTGAQAQNATYVGAGTTPGEWTDGTNWQGGTTPTGIADFTNNAATPTAVTIKSNVAAAVNINTIQFDAGASAYSITDNNIGGFAINGLGIVNNSGATQSFSNNTNTMSFNNASPITGTVSILNNKIIAFNQTSTAGTATITNPGSLIFNNFSSAANASILNVNNGTIAFTGNSNGGNAALVNSTAGNVIDFSGSKGPNNDNQLSAGSIAGAGIFFLGANTLTVGGNNTSTIVPGVISDGNGENAGTGASLVKTGTGTLTLAGTNAYTGNTTVNQGALVVTGSIATSPMTTVTGGTLGGTGTIFGLAVQSGGTVAPGFGGNAGTFSTLTAKGNATFAAGSSFNVNINSAGQNDKLVVVGNATINGGTVNANALGGTGITTASTFTILTAGSVTGSFTSATSNLAFLTVHATTTNGNSVVLSFTAAPSMSANSMSPAFAASANTANQIAVANAVQALGSGPVFNAVIGQSAAGAQQAFNALSGEVHASTVTAAFSDATLPNTAILDRLNEVALPPTDACADDLRSRKPGLAPVAVRMCQPRMFDLWGQGFGDWGRISSDGNAASLSRATGGFVLGGDVSATNFMGGDWRFGLAGGYTNDSITVNQRGSSSTFESVFGGAYAGASFGALQLRAGALYGTNTTSTTRQVVFPGFFEALSSNNGGYTAQGFGEAGYRIQLSGGGLGGGSRVSVEPFAGAAAFVIHQNGFTEVGGTSALTASARDFNVQTTTLGVRGELAFASMPLTLKTMLGWRHAYGDGVPSVLLSFQGGAQAFSVSGVPIDRDAFVAEAGIDYSLTSMLSVGVSYSGQYGQRATDNAFKGNVNLRF